MLSCIIVEDELMSRKSLQRLCERHNSLDVRAMFDNAIDALAFLNEHPVDLIWLDVEMPGLSGFDLLKSLPSQPYIVLTTNNTNHAFNAFQQQVTDFIKKPISLPRFDQAVEKILQLAGQGENGTLRDIYIKTDGRYVRLPLDVIIYVENIGDYVRIVTTSQTYIVYATMKELEGKLGKQFLRVHRSYIVQLRKIVDIEENTLVVTDKVIPISRANKSELMSRLNRL